MSRFDSPFWTDPLHDERQEAAAVARDPDDHVSFPPVPQAQQDRAAQLVAAGWTHCPSPRVPDVRYDRTYEENLAAATKARRVWRDETVPAWRARMRERGLPSEDSNVGPDPHPDGIRLLDWKPTA